MIYGWDISTSIIGVCILGNDGKYAGESYYIDLTDVDGPLAKADYAKASILNILKMQNDAEQPYPNYHFVEDRLGGFAAGRTMLQTLMKLAAFNAVISYIIWENEKNPMVLHLHPSTVKSVMKKEGLFIPKGSDKKDLTLAFVRRKEPDFPWMPNKNNNPKPQMFDMADAYCIAKAGYHRLCTERENSQPSKMSSETTAGKKVKR